jgi:glyoxylase-like metal-dependent hydrolase (beta-lactamase superfamily II)
MKSTRNPLGGTAARGVLALVVGLAAASGPRGALADEYAAGSNQPLVGIASPMAAEHATWQLPAEYPRVVGAVSILQIRPDVYMLTVDNVNVVVETGWQGTLVVGTAPATHCDDLVTAVRSVAEGPIRYLVSVNANADRLGCNSKLAEAGTAFVKGTLDFAAPVIAHQNALLEVLTPNHTFAATTLPTELYTRPVRSMVMNDQTIQVLWAPKAHSSGDSLVVFRRSDVVVAGDVMDTTRFPVIDIAHGGSIQGLIAVMNRLLDELAVEVSPKWQRPGGTLIVPGRGHLCQLTDVLNYRDMLTIIRDRVQDLIAHGKKLEQVQAANPARGYTTRYGATTGDWTTSQFIAAVYQSLVAERRGARKK